MRLLNTRTHRLEYVLSSNIPEYAILSHRWGDINDEAHFSDISDDSIALPETKGFQKLVSSCKQASKDGYKYIWIDTCCIDKSSSAELSEAINSMFKWYRQARICYAYLEDVRKAQDWKETERQIRKSKWFTRGWTLQELIAPPEVLFFDDAWTRLGKRNHKGSQVMLTEVTGVSGSILCRNDLAACTIEDQPQMHSLRDGKCIKCCKPDELPELLNDFSVAQRMSWSATRETTRLEDQAYCLLGLFDVNMPLLYGEGKKAFLRLQEEIIKKSDSQSILAHEALDRSWKHDLGLLAESPSFFSQSDILDPELVEISRDRKRSPLTLNSKSIEVGIYLCPCSIAPGHDTEYWMGILDCSFGNDAVSRPGLILTSTGPEDETFCRLSGSRLVRVGPTTSQGKIPVNTEQGLVTCKFVDFYIPYAYQRLMEAIAIMEIAASRSPIISSNLT
jgi:hypothetical protein